MLKLMFKFLGVLLLLLLIVLLFNFKTVKRLKHVVSLFDEDKIVHNFLHMEDYVETRSLIKSTNPFTIPKNISFELPETFESRGKTFSVKEYIDYTRTTGFMIIHKDSIVYEYYGNGMKENSTHISWSVAKSFVSALVGIALEEKLFDSIQDPITKYLPQFKGTGYDGVTIKDILQMSTGVGFNEDYRDFHSDINRFGRFFALGKSFEKFSLTLDREKEPGTFNHYVSINTQVLGMLITKVSGKTLTAFMQEKLWDPIGMQDNAHWIIDNEGMEMALGGLNASLRDYAKLGLLFLHKGNWMGTQIVPESWVTKSVTPDEPHLQPGEHELSTSIFGYGYQWWIPEVPKGDFFAAGIYNQYIYVQPSKDLIIVKTSANHHFRDKDDQSKIHHSYMFQQLADQF